MPAEIDTGGPRVLHCHYRADDCPIPIVGSASADEACSSCAADEQRRAVHRRADLGRDRGQDRQESVSRAGHRCACWLPHVLENRRRRQEEEQEEEEEVCAVECRGAADQAAREGESQGNRRRDCQGARRARRRQRSCQGDCQGGCRDDLRVREEPEECRGSEQRDRRQPSVRQFATCSSVGRGKRRSRILRLAARSAGLEGSFEAGFDASFEAETRSARIEDDERHARNPLVWRGSHRRRSEVRVAEDEEEEDEEDGGGGEEVGRLAAASIVPFECDSILRSRLDPRCESAESRTRPDDDHRRLLSESGSERQPQFSSHPHSHHPEKGKNAFLNSSLSPAADKEWEKEIRSNSLRYPGGVRIGRQKPEDSATSSVVAVGGESAGWKRSPCASGGCSYLRLAFLLFLVAFGQNGLLKSGVLNFSARPTVATGLSVFAFGTIVGAVSGAPVELIGDSGVRAERSANLSHITGASRKIQMYIKNRHLQILPDGTVNGSNDDTSDYTIFQRTSVSRGQLRIQGVATCLYLCMDSCGLLYGSRDYTEDCVFNETLEQHNYNTYSSVRWSTAKKTLYLGLNRRGQPRRVQAKGHNLGRLSAYARVLTQVAPPDRVETLQSRMLGAQHNVRHRHNSHAHHHHRGDLGQQTVCPTLPPQEKDGRDRFRCRKRKKRKKRKRRCRPGEKPGPQCQVPEDVIESNPTPVPDSVQSKRSCEGLASEEACRRQALSVLSKKRKSRLEDSDNNNENDDNKNNDDDDEDTTQDSREATTTAVALPVAGRDPSNGKNKAPSKKPSAGGGVSLNKKPNLTDGKKRKRKVAGPRRRVQGPSRGSGFRAGGRASARQAKAASAQPSTASSSSSPPAAAAAAAAGAAYQPTTAPSSAGRRPSPRRRPKLTSRISDGQTSQRRRLDRNDSATLGPDGPGRGSLGGGRPMMRKTGRLRADAGESSTKVPESLSTTRADDLGRRPSESSFADEELTTVSVDPTTTLTVTTSLTTTTVESSTEANVSRSTHRVESEEVDVEDDDDEEDGNDDEKAARTTTAQPVTRLPIERLAM